MPLVVFGPVAKRSGLVFWQFLACWARLLSGQGLLFVVFLELLGSFGVCEGEGGVLTRTSFCEAGGLMVCFVVFAVFSMWSL